MNRKTVLVVVPLLLILILVVSYILVNRANFGVIHDVAVTDVKVSGNQWYVGENVSIEAVVENRGNVNETFNVTSFYNMTEIAAETATSLAPSANITVRFNWNTSGVTAGNLMIKVETSEIPGESNTSDNSFSYGPVLLRYQHTQGAVLYVDPAVSEARVARELTVEVNVANATDLYGWELRLSYNNTVLNLTEITQESFLRDVGITYFSYKKSLTENTVVADCTLLGNVPGASGSGTLATFKFYVRNTGVSFLDLFNTTLLSSFEKDLDYTTIDGVFNSIP